MTHRHADPFPWILLGVGATALVARLLHIWQIRAAPFFTVLMGDSRSYDQWAQQLAQGEWIGRDVFYQAPLYPYFLGGIYAVAGRGLLLVRIVQAVVGSMSCVLLALAGRRFFSDRAGALAGFMLALYAPAIFFDGLLQKSVLDVFFICLSLWLIARTQTPLPLGAQRARRSTSWAWLCLGAAMGGLSLTRENALVFVVVIVGWALVDSDRRPTARASRLERAVLFLSGLAIVLVPVAARNSYVGGGFYVTTSQFGPNFYIGNNPKSDGTYQSLRFGRGAPEYERQDATELAELALGRKLSPSDVSGYWTGRAVAFITSQPAAWLKLVVRKLALLCNDTEMVDTEDQATHAEWSWPLRLLGSVARFGVLVPLAVLGVILGWRTRSRWWILLALAAAYAASVVLFYVFARYRFPLVPFLILFAAAGLALSSVDGLRLHVRRRRALGIVAAVVGAAALASFPLLSADLMRAVTENNLGVALQAERRYEEAADHYRRSTALRPDYAPAYNNLATALRASGRLDDAVATYQRALALRFDYPEAHYNLANVLMDQGRTDEAVDHFQRALRSIPAAPDVHNNLGIALVSQGRTDDAIVEFRKALRSDPQSVKAHRNLGDALAVRGSLAEAIDELRQATELDPADAAARYDLASTLLDAGRLDDAIKEFRAAIALAPDSVEARNNLGIALGSKGHLDEAIEQFQEALKRKPDLADARRNLEMALAARRQLKKRD